MEVVRQHGREGTLGVEVACLHEGEGLAGGKEGEVISDPTVEETSGKKEKENITRTASGTQSDKF